MCQFTKIAMTGLNASFLEETHTEKFFLNFFQIKPKFWIVITLIFNLIVHGIPFGVPN